MAVRVFVLRLKRDFTKNRRIISFSFILLPEVKEMEKDTTITPEQLSVINEAAAILQALSTHDIMSSGDILIQNEENVDMKRIKLNCFG
jgi:hypothetical protein